MKQYGTVQGTYEDNQVYLLANLGRLLTIVIRKNSGESAIAVVSLETYMVWIHMMLQYHLIAAALSQFRAPSAGLSSARFQRRNIVARKWSLVTRRNRHLAMRTRWSALFE